MMIGFAFVCGGVGCFDYAMRSGCGVASLSTELAGFWVRLLWICCMGSLVDWVGCVFGVCISECFSWGFMQLIGLKDWLLLYVFCEMPFVMC